MADDQDPETSSEARLRQMAHVDTPFGPVRFFSDPPAGAHFDAHVLDDMVGVADIAERALRQPISSWQMAEQYLNAPPEEPVYYRPRQEWNVQVTEELLRAQDGHAVFRLPNHMQTGDIVRLHVRFTDQMDFFTDKKGHRR